MNIRIKSSVWSKNEHPTQTVWVRALNGQRVVAQAWYERLRNSRLVWYEYGVHVNADFRGNGIADRLLAEFRSLFPQAHIICLASHDNEPQNYRLDANGYRALISLGTGALWYLEPGFGPL